MVDFEKKIFFIGLVLLVLGSDVLFSLSDHYDWGSLVFFVVGIVLIYLSFKRAKEDFEEAAPEIIQGLIYYPKLPYFQTLVVFLLFLSTLFFIPDPLGILVILLGLGISQAILTIFKKYMKDRMKVLTVIKFQIFTFFSIHFYVTANDLFISRPIPDVFTEIFVLLAWIAMFLNLYLKFKD